LKIPNDIIINGITYKILIKKPVKCNLSEEQFRGSADYKDATITISNAYQQESKERTLIHEILHILDDDYKIDLSEDHIRRIATGIYTVLKSNKLLKED